MINNNPQSKPNSERGIAAYFIKNRVISWMISLILLIGGIQAFLGLGRLEDPAFTIKQAMVVTQYPGATPQQVEEEVTYPIEKAIGQLPYIKEVTSTSSRGLSQVSIEVESHFTAEVLPQIWDELRRKINDLTPSLAPGVKPPKVIDDFGDVYGVLLSVTGNSYSYKELQDYVDYLRRELELIDGVGKVSVSGMQQEQVIIEISMNKLSQLGLSLDNIYNLLSTQNIVNDAGGLKVGNEYIRIHPTGNFANVSELNNLIISGGNDNLIRLGDVATISRDYVEVPTNILKYNGDLALNVGVSFQSGINVVNVGNVLDSKLNQLLGQQPIGIKINQLYNQPKEVDKSVSGFVVSLAQAVAIVIVVLLFFMGLRSGLLIGLILLLTVLGTFIFMKIQGIELQRISLGALVIALGMLVDNAIVVVEGILIGTQKGRTKLQAATDVVKQTKWPLLGATVIAITAFAPIGLSQDSTGEFVGSLFYVLLISLMLSWFTAISITPFFADLLFKESVTKDNQASEQDPYKGIFFTVYKSLLTFCMKRAWLTILVLVLSLGGSIWGFGHVKQAFFPYSMTPMFLTDVWLPEGTDIRTTNKKLDHIESWLQQQDHVEYVATTAGQGLERFMLTYAKEKSYPAYGQIVVRADDYEALDPLIKKLRTHIATYYPDISAKQDKLLFGPGGGAKIEARIIGPDPDILRKIAKQYTTILNQDPNAKSIRHDWRSRTKVIEPKFNENQARRYGVTKPDIDEALKMSYSGLNVGIYRDGTSLLPIVARLPQQERANIEQMDRIQIWSPVISDYVPLGQVVNGYDIIWEDPLVVRKDRKRVLTVMSDPDILGEETAATLQKRIQPLIEAVDLPDGYSLEWGGEYESSQKSRKALFSSMPMGYLFMFLITVFLFNSIREPLIVWCTVPLALIGVTVGLLSLNSPFSFMALLGLLSLSGMILKNGIVLLDQIKVELSEGKSQLDAVMNAAVSRVRPVCMAAITTILGMIPLLTDVFFEPMAVTIMFGLGFATILTLVVVPVLYRVFYRIKMD
ncbi:efflux RND transporter permease subunit [Vibrio sp. SS-MA-C1-2]|uniref:efflux RND transporter permease subunit n=1 Tax=Vibrio sp. SS-MA-C1-2 TaxID=2908646 RepID=UPI001F24B37F|nr:efflux RND transporter permease subunit [Vibrio sp. SS-MA-C1-2]UJF17159.1 efflux RND transporter permease subunit [Vibrio sp. SS-MA-C1-2]